MKLINNLVWLKYVGANLLLSIDDVKSCENLIKSSKILVTNLEIATEVFGVQFH